MLRSMFTAISALSLHQAYMDVVADNLANVNTPGFKASRVSFQDQFAQILSAGAAPSANMGGINPTQIGLGARLGTISIGFSQGTLQATGRATDMAIQGDGFFIYADGTKKYFSRDGTISMDSDGYLVNPATGFRLQGWQTITSSGSAASIDTGLPSGDIQIPIDATMARATTSVTMGGNIDSASASGSAGTVNVTLGGYDSLGVLHSVTVEITKTSDNNWTWIATAGGTGSGTIVFDSNGQYVSGGGSITIPASGGATDTVISLDLSTLSQLASSNSISAVNQNGLAAGSLAGFTVISNSGEIFGTFSNGLQQLIGQIGLAGFVNPTGLIRVGKNLFLAGLNSGDPSVGVAGTGSLGTVISGYLESSNVDLGMEFTNMILAQRGFQASARVITTSDEMLQELVNIAR